MPIIDIIRDSDADNGEIFLGYSYINLAAVLTVFFNIILCTVFMRFMTHIFKHEL
jgi:hypothetical protein